MSTIYVDSSILPTTTTTTYNPTTRNPDTGSDTCKSTIAAGLAAMAAADTLDIRAGTYAESIGPTALKSGTSNAARTTIQGHTAETVILLPTTGNSNGDVIDVYDKDFINITNLIFDGTNVANYVLRIGGNTGTDRSSYITFTSCTFRYALVGVQTQGNGGDSNHINYTDCICHDNGSTATHHGFYVNSRDSVLDGCIAYNCSGHGFHIYAGSGSIDGLVIKNCTAYNNGSYGIGLYRGTGALIYNNIVYHCGLTIASTGGIRVGSGRSADKIYNNTVYGCTGYGIRVESGISGTKVRNNILYLNTSTAFSDLGSGTESGQNITVNPLFTNEGTHDLHITPGSPAIGTGYSLYSLFTTDFEDNARPNEAVDGTLGTWDAGAYEYTPPPGSITVVSPGNGTSVKIGDTLSISWTSVGVSGNNVHVELSRNAGNNWEDLAANTTNDGALDWECAGNASNSCQIRITDSNDSVSDTSDGNFIIAANVTGNISLTLPVIGSSFPKGFPMRVRWTTENVSGNLKIELSRDAGGNNTWETLNNAFPYDGPDYTWTTTVPSSSICKVKVSSVNDPTVYAVSGEFRIGGTYF